MEIRFAQPADAPAIALVHVRSWQSAYTGVVPQEHLDALDPAEESLRWTERLAAAAPPRARVLVAESDHRVIAFAGFRPVGDTSEDGEIHTLYAHPGHWGTGVGRALLAATTTALETAGYRHGTLWVLAANTRARRFYEAAGWRFDGTTTEGTDDGPALRELRYRKPLTGTGTQT